MNLQLIIDNQFLAFAFPIGNLRIIDNNGYEYRTNAQSLFRQRNFENIEQFDSRFYSFNFNQEGGVSLSDVVGITLNLIDSGEPPELVNEWIAEPVQAIFSPFDIDIYDLNEVPFSCRDVIFSCVDEDNPLLEELLSVAGSANVASFEYGINNAIPHSRGGDLLCPGNNIGDGTVVLRPEPYPESVDFQGPPIFAGFVGLNNGNARGSFDAFWVYNLFLFPDRPRG